MDLLKLSTPYLFFRVFCPGDGFSRTPRCAEVIVGLKPQGTLRALIKTKWELVWGLLGAAASLRGSCASILVISRMLVAIVL